MILILTQALDPHADVVERLLRDRGAEVVRIDPAAFPVQAGLSLEFSTTGRARAAWHTDQGPIDLHRVRAIWFRRPGHLQPHAEITDEVTRAYVTEECKSFLLGVWDSLDCPFLPATPAVLRRAESKAPQLRLAGALGFELPPTLVTNSAEEFLEFYRRHGGNLISKLASVCFHRIASAEYTRFTEVVSRRDVGYARSVRYCPIIFQAYVPKRVELRITVVGREVFAAEIHSQETNHTRHDWRKYDYAKTPYFPHELPSAVASRCVQLVRRLGLRYGTIDMVLTPEGRYVFLEINPNGQYLWIEEATGLPISDAICDLLLSAAPEGDPTDGGGFPREVHDDVDAAAGAGRYA
jgi:hypothetical protein